MRVAQYITPHRLTRPALILLTLLAHPGVFAQTHPLNDTGQIHCYNASAAIGVVSSSNPDPEPTGFNEQDCTQGRAASDAVGVLYKAGGSSRLGADYTRIANNGSEWPATATLGSGPNDWACTRDNVTGLIWEIKVNDVSNLRHGDHTYTWYDTNAAVNGGTVGTIGTNSTCNSTLVNCNTTAYRDAVNAAGLCGASDWRLPSVDELQSLADYGATGVPRIDTSWFPNSALSYWSGQNAASGAANAWIHNDGLITPVAKSSPVRVRLVRGGQ